MLDSDAQVERIVTPEGSSGDRGKSFDLWHATFHCVSHMVAYVDRQAAVEQHEWTVVTVFFPQRNDICGGLHVPPPVPPPLA